MSTPAPPLNIGSNNPSACAQSQQQQQGNSSGASPWINKLKIVGSGQHWAVAACGPFYLMSAESASDASLTGSTNLIEHYGLANAYHKLCGKRLGQELSTFLPSLSGDIDVSADNDSSGLQALIDRPPICGKEILPMSQAQAELAFRLHAGPLPPRYANLFSHTAAGEAGASSASPLKRREHRKRRRDVSREANVTFDAALPGDQLGGGGGGIAAAAGVLGAGGLGGAGGALAKMKRPRRSDDDEKRRRKKKEKKKKKEKE